MALGKQNPSWVTDAPAKLNLYLNILDRRDDGFHELETLMVPIRFSDSLQLEVRSPKQEHPGSISLEVHRSQHLRTAGDSDSIPAGRENLVVRALELLQQKSGCDSGAHVKLVKRIPAGSGLGGGSSDAAAALRLANQAWRLDWNQEQLLDLAAEVGCDVPFFLLNQPAVCRGRGERLEPISDFPPLHFVIVRPPISLATAKVFEAYDRLPNEPECGPSANVNVLVERLCSKRNSGNRQIMPSLMRNGLQNAASNVAARLAEVRSSLWRTNRSTDWVTKLCQVFEKLDVVAHLLTGSGSAYFGICRNSRQAASIVSRLRGQGLGLVLATCSCR